jgi:DEAD/DEAH box helicase domain-containing protein
VIIATSSASGKTLCYNIVVLQSMLSAPGGRAIYLFPTKALAQDQLSTLH